ncbi:D-galactose-binding periplasmic protein [Muribaculaceae bacterium]|nr:D-galactose-binding periplasmic protein [Muribaculaceae bacterium]
MIKAAAASKDSFMIKRQTRELENNLKNLCLYDFTCENGDEQQVLEEEWNDFARCYLASCVESKSYCSTLFNMVPLQDSAIDALKAAEISPEEWPVVVGIDGTDVGLESVKSGEMAGTVYNDKEGQARGMLDLAYALATDQDTSELNLEDGKYIRLPYQKILSEDVYQYLK